MVGNIIYLILFSFGLIMTIVDLARVRRKNFSEDPDEFKRLYINNKLLMILIFVYLVATNAGEIWNFGFE